MDLGRGGGAVVIWGFAEQSKKNHTIVFLDILGFRQIVLGFQTGPPGRPACCADKGYPI